MCSGLVLFSVRTFVMTYLLYLALIFLVVGLLLGALWRWRTWCLFALVAVISFTGGFFVASFPTYAQIFSGWGSLLLFLVNYGIYFSILVSVGALGSFLGLLITGKLNRRSNSRPAVPSNQQSARISE